MSSPMPSGHHKALVHQISDYSDPRPSKRPKIAASEQKEAINGRVKAERWFNDSNNNASATRDVPYIDSESHLYIPLSKHLAHLFLDDPPFYLNEKTYSGGHSACAVHSDGSSFNLSTLGQPTAPTRSLLAQMEASESNSEDFRGVIDDLTIQNKKLRRKLKQYERLHGSHLQKEKLFEVRIHGLAAHRKRELEEILRSFASSSEESHETSLFNVGTFKASAPALKNHNPSSSSTSYSKGSKPLDSAYASMSGQTGVSHSQSQDRPQKDMPAQSLSRQQNVKSYLHDIPETLLPKHSLQMSERAKSKLVVKRLEQIFTGKKAAGRHSQSYQQQEVSQSAAQADRIGLEAHGRKFQRVQEGVREARILPKHAELKVDSLSKANLVTQQSQQNGDSRGRQPLKEGTREARILLGCAESQIDSSSETNRSAQLSRQDTDGEDSRSRDPRASRGVTPDQRPTRPLDLDIHRAQVPSENIEYIRHLGLASPTATLDADPESDNGWVFLNLLTNMAQLHTLNVTPEFIRQAVADVSSKFELSADGTKVKWRGGSDGTRLSSDSDESDNQGNRKITDTSAAVSKQGILADLPSSAGSEDIREPNSALPLPTISLPAALEVGAKRRPVYLEQSNDVDKFQYKPLFFHGAASEDDDKSTHATKSVSSFDPMENATGFNSGSHGVRESEVKLRKQNRENGPIIFYKKARFCTDLSGDSSSAMHDEATYCRFTEEPIGCLQHPDPERMDATEIDYVPDGNDFRDSMEIDIGEEFTTRSALDLEDLRSSISDVSAPSPIPMECSGIGNTHPEDNFMVKVQVRHGRRKRQGSRPQSPISRLPSQIRRLLCSKSRGSANTSREAKDIPRSQPDQGPIKIEIISTVKTDMAPSLLPPPSNLFTSSSDSGDDDDQDKDSSVNSYSEKPRISAKSSVEDLVDPSAGNFFLGSSSDESREPSYVSTLVDSDDDSSIDFLANARVLDPDTIAAQEREFEINAMQQQARAGSFNATLGEPTSSDSGPPETSKTESDVDSMSVDGDAEDD